MLLTYETLDSTNDEARRLLDAGTITELTAIVAAQQTGGKGTRGRQWVSPPGCGLYLTIVHPFELTPHVNIGLQSPDAHPPVTPIYTLAAGVACADTLNDLTGLTFQLKPVNDIYIENKKLGGILTESVISDGRLKALITGIGINLRTHAEVATQAEQTGNIATSLDLHLPSEKQVLWQSERIIPDLTKELMAAVDFRYMQIREGRKREVLEAYLRLKLPGFDLPELAMHF